jgi:signal transduction histidine kinase
VAARVGVAGQLTTRPTTAEVTLLRSVQGALANVRTHADAHQVVVSIDETQDSVRVDVVDDGRGFDTEVWTATAPGSPRDGGYGLRATRARLRELGGGLAVESAPGEGTALSAWLPLSHTSKEQP